MSRHLQDVHKDSDMRCLPQGTWQKPGEKNYRMDTSAYSNAAVMKKEQEHVPIIGPAIDRRILTILNKLANSDTLQSAVCFVCAQLHTWVQSWTQIHGEAWPNFKSQAPIRWLKLKIRCWLGKIWTHICFWKLSMSLDSKNKFAAENEAHDNPFSNASELKVGDTEWQRKLFISEKNVALWILCCPEDVNARKSRRCQHNDDVLCAHCEIPVCCKCESKWPKGENHKIPMAIGNDNLWGYTSDIIVKHKVTWLEAAIVSPCWNQMIVYYVEGDSGHLMNEFTGAQKFRTVVRGSYCSYQMPWEDVLQDVKATCKDRNISYLPSPQECLKYFLRVHLTVNGFDYKKHLKQVHVRQFVLLALLFPLIDRNLASSKSTKTYKNL